ncbi:MAG: hypothetical protein HFJ57_04995 [Clostridia bacterium]|nr:hypothetical protein [Clostridia bacterium]
MKKLKISLIVIIVLLLILIVSTIVLNQTGVIKRIADNINKEEIKKEITCQVYSHVDGKTAILVIVEDTENGIDKIVYPDNEMTLSCNGKTKVAFDYNTDITGKDSLTFTAINTKGEEIEKTILINDKFYLDLIGYTFTDETKTQKALTVNYKDGSTTKQYKIGEATNWTNYTGIIRLDDYQILDTLGQENKETNVYLRQIDKMGYEIVTKVKYVIDDNVTYKQEDTVIEGDSILACVENNTLESGNYIFKVTGKLGEENEEGVIETKTETMEYPVELYNYDGDANYITNNIGVIAERTYTGMGKINSEKRMLILKYNGNLTINNGATITPTGTNESINEATYLCTKKGMLIYCVGTLTNNGTITMTARGTVNQEGENVYLYKNEDNSYEYVPAVGASGGASVSIRQWGTPGATGNVGVSRKTGGGGSGAAAIDGGYSVSGTGGNGSSYSGGSGGGGSGKGTAGSGSSTGGKGGNGTSAGSNSTSGGGGAGNPGGHYGAQNSGTNGGTGTGGLLVVYGTEILNNGVMSSNGSNGGKGHTSGGGGSGGGSINLFYKTDLEKGTLTVSGGSSGSYTGSNFWNSYRRNGGAGGAGSITIGNISTGTFVKDE